MEPIAVIFPLAKGADAVVDPAFAREYEACEALETFEVALCNTEDCIAGDTLVIDRVADRKTTYSLLRTPPTWRTAYDRIERALKHKGFKLVVNWSGHRQYSWTDDKTLLNMYAKEILEEARNIPPHKQKAEWRAYYFDGVYFFGARLRRGRKDDKPSEELVKRAEGNYCIKPFTYVDFYKHERGYWLPLECGDAQFSLLPKGASAVEFYSRLADVIAGAPHLPEWTWCLVGDIVDGSKAGMEGRPVRGTRHFAPGTKVFLIDELGGNGWERPVVLGVPRYCDHLVSVVMSIRKIQNLRCEKVYDRQVIAVMENSYKGDFFSPIRSAHGGTWDRSYRSLNDIAILLDWIPRCYGVSRGREQEDYFNEEGWANRKFRHVCEVCGKEEMLTPNEAKAAGWNYPSKLGDFGVLSPRICGECPVEETFWWAQSKPGMNPYSKEIPYEKREVYKRILAEPDELFGEVESHENA